VKLVLAIGVQVALVFALATSCSITHKSGAYACTKTSDCDSGRDCVGGFCVVSGTEDIDAPGAHHDAPPPIDGNGCPAQCSSCVIATHSCVIDCQNGSNCNGNVACPAGWACDVKCDSDNSCRNGVSCAGTTSCKVECSGRSSCEDVVCGTGRCNVTCTGVQSCQKMIECGQSCGCDVTCNGSQSCPAGEVTCTSAACDLGTGCTSLPAVCHTCS